MAVRMTSSKVQAPHSVARLHDSMRRAWSSAGAVGTRRPAVPKWLPRCTLTATRCTRLGEKFGHGLQCVSNALAVASPPPPPPHGPSPQAYAFLTFGHASRALQNFADAAQVTSNARNTRPRHSMLPAGGRAAPSIPASRA